MASLVSLVASAALLVALYRSLDVRLIGQTLLQADRLWLVVSVGIILPITVLRAVRFFLVAPGALSGVGEALRVTLAASALNVVLPSKAGDLIKSYVVATRGRMSAGVALSIIIYERLCDLFGLITWCLLGWLSGRPQVPGAPTAFWLLIGLLGGGEWNSGLVGTSGSGAAGRRGASAASKETAETAGAGGWLAEPARGSPGPPALDRLLLDRALACASVPDVDVLRWRSRYRCPPPYS